MTEESGQAKSVVAEANVLRGSYANNVVIRHSAEDFVLDFMYVGPEGGVLGNRVILTPNHYKRLLKAMGENMTKYEEKFGAVPEQIKEKSV